MSTTRVFLPQDTLEAWLANGRGHVVGETLFLAGSAFDLESAVRFMSEVAGGGDAQNLVGRVKSLSQIEQLGGEHCSDSVVLGDNAYEVIEGFLASPSATQKSPAASHDELVRLFAHP
jgi:hypothetical protein